MEEEVFTRLFEQAEIAKFTRKELQEYEESLKAYRDWYSVTKTSFDKGKAIGSEQGKAVGLEEGKAEKTKEVARKLISLVLPTEIIAQSTGLNPEDIDKMRR